MSSREGWVPWFLYMFLEWKRVQISQTNFQLTFRNFFIHLYSHYSILYLTIFILLLRTRKRVQCSIAVYSQLGGRKSKERNEQCKAIVYVGQFSRFSISTSNCKLDGTLLLRILFSFLYFLRRKMLYRCHAIFVVL